jgi:GGDEF domain-containing protein
MGFAYFNDSDNDYKDTLTRADEALYEAKESGRNNWKIK